MYQLFTNNDVFLNKHFDRYKNLCKKLQCYNSPNGLKLRDFFGCCIEMLRKGRSKNEKNHTYFHKMKLN